MKKLNKKFISIQKLTAILFAILYISITILSCSKEEIYKKDPYSNDKRRHKFFRCKVNGEEWTWNPANLWNSQAIAYYTDTYQPGDTLTDGRFDIRMANYPDKSKYESIHIFVINNLKEGENNLNNIYASHNYYHYRVFSEYKPHSKYYYLDSNYYNSLYIMDIDSINYIITGQFEFRAVTGDAQDTVLVTDGEFDWKVLWFDR